MEAFEIGKHVIIELADERKIAGYLTGVTEDSVYLKATHKDAELDWQISDETVEHLTAYYHSRSTVWLTAQLVLEKQFNALISSRNAKIAVLLDCALGQLREQLDDGMQMRELAIPVSMYIARNAIATATDTDELMQENEVSIFDQTLEASLRKMLEKDQEEETEED